MTPAEVLAQAKPRTGTVMVSVRGDLRARHQALTVQLMALLASAKPTDPVVEQLAELEAEMAAADIVFELRSIGSDWDLLLAAHPGPNGQFDPIAFPEAAAAASITSPDGWTEKDLHQLRAIIPAAEFAKLWDGVLEVNVSRAELPKFGVLFASVGSSEPNSTTAAPEASPTASSPAE